MEEKPTYEELQQRIEKLEEALGHTQRMSETEVTEEIPGPGEVHDGWDEAEKTRKLILDTMQEMLAYYDKDLRIQWANKAAADSVDMETEDLIGMHCYKLWQQRSTPCEACPVLEAMRLGRPQDHELSTPDGRYLRLRGYPVHDDHGELIGAVEYGIDITKRKKAEEARSKSEALLRTVFEQSPCAILLIDAQTGETIEFNEQAHRQLGYSREEFSELTVVDIEDVESPEEIKRHMDKILKEGRDTFETRHRAKDGRIIDVIVNSRRIYIDGALYFVSLWTDITHRKRSEEALRDSEERYRSVLETINEGIILQSASGEILTWNKGAEEVFAISSMEAIGQRSGGLDWPTIHEDGSRYQGKDHPSMRTLRTGKPCRNQVMGVYQPSGELRWISINTNPLFRNDEDMPYAVAISFSDITETEQQRKELQESQAMLKAAMDFSQAGIEIVEAPSGKLRYVNESALLIRGGGKSGIVTDIDFDGYIASRNMLHFDGSAYKKDEVPLARAILYGETCSEELIIRRPDGEERIVLANAAPIRNGQGEIIYGIVIFLDITEHKRAENELQKSEERLKLALDSVRDAVWDWRVDTGEVYFSSRWYTMLGYDPYELPQQFETWRSLVHPDDLPGSERVIFRHLELASPFEIEFRMRTKEGQWRWILARGKTVEKDEQGVAVRMLGTHVDITERKRLEERMQQSQKMEAIGTLAGGIAHDFNNILGIILGNTELAMFDIPDGSPAQGSLKEVREASLRARDLITQILLFARRKEQTVSNVSIGSIAKESLKMLRSTIPSTVEIRQDIEEGLPTVSADAAQIQQIIVNLCANAGQVMEAAGGTLTFNLDLVELTASMDTVAGHIPPDRYLRIRVQDTGPGIPPEILERIFEPFFTTKGVGEGTGLGLAVVHGIVQDRQGGILVESEEGKGTAFTVYLPASEEKLTTRAPQEGTEVETGNERILFVDDESMITTIAQRMLEQQNYAVETCASGTEALEVFGADPDRFDLVVTDMTMPGMRGDKLATEMMKIRADIPIILTTGYSRQISEEQAKELGIRAFVMKPLTRDELLKAVRQVLDEH